MRKIVVSLLTSKQSFQKMQAEEARAAGQRAGVEVEVVFADGNMIAQVQHLMKYVLAPPDDRPAALIVEPSTADAFERLGQTAVQAGIGWIPVHCIPPYIATLKLGNPSIPVSCVAVDDIEAGATQARQVIALLKHGGQIMLLQGPRGNAAVGQRRQGLNRELKAFGRIQIVADLYADWTKFGAEQTFGAYLRTQTNVPRPGLIVCQNDSMALGVETMLCTLRPAWGKVRLLGIDGIPDEGQRFVRDGTLTATVITPATAGKGVELAVKALSGQSIPPSLVLPVESFPPLQTLM